MDLESKELNEGVLRVDLANKGVRGKVGKRKQLAVSNQQAWWGTVSEAQCDSRLLRRRGEDQVFKEQVLEGIFFPIFRVAKRRGGLCQNPENKFADIAGGEVAEVFRDRISLVRKPGRRTGHTHRSGG